MRWEYKYPAVKMDEDVPAEHLWRSGVIGKCFMCYRRTSWIDLCFEAHLCSEECLQEAFIDIARRTQEADRSLTKVDF